jgi:hypothetical protein
MLVVGFAGLGFAGYRHTGGKRGGRHLNVDSDQVEVRRRLHESERVETGRSVD